MFRYPFSYRKANKLAVFKEMIVLKTSVPNYGVLRRCCSNRLLTNHCVIGRINSTRFSLDKALCRWLSFTSRRIVIKGRLYEAESIPLSTVLNNSSSKLSTSSILRAARRMTSNEDRRRRHLTTLNYTLALIAAVFGLSYAAVPLYRVFCQVTGIGGASNLAQHGGDKIESLQKVTNRKLRIIFNADTASHLHWHFKPLQREVLVYPGETALAFYSAENPTDQPIVGISTYTVLPYEAAKYLNKIQCFCFEEQRLNPHEQVDMPVFFYIDPEFCNDASLAKSNTITLSYMFFEAKEGVKFLPQQFTTPSVSSVRRDVVSV